MKRLVVPVFVLAVALFWVYAADAQDRKKAAHAARLKVILKKIDPEIRAAQLSLKTSKKKLETALNDEVFKEKGAVEGKVIDQLKVALKHVDSAIKAANKAQRIDLGGD